MICRCGIICSHLCVAGVHALATAADYDADRAAGHRTLAVAFGTTGCRGTHVCSILLRAGVFGDFESVAVRALI